MLASLTRLQRYYLLYSGGFLMFVGALAVLEQHGMPPRWIGYSFLIFTISMYAVIGIMSRTTDVSEFYVAGRRVPAFFNGMATGADWMSAASFIGLAGTLYLSGYQGLAFVLGWTGGFVLVALLLAVPLFLILYPFVPELVLPIGKGFRVDHLLTFTVVLVAAATARSWAAERRSIA